MNRAAVPSVGKNIKRLADENFKAELFLDFAGGAFPGPTVQASIFSPESQWMMEPLKNAAAGSGPSKPGAWGGPEPTVGRSAAECGCFKK